MPTPKELRELIRALVGVAKPTKAGMLACDKAYPILRQLYTDEERAEVLRVFPADSLEDALDAIGSAGVHAILYPSES